MTQLTDSPAVANGRRVWEVSSVALWKVIDYSSISSCRGIFYVKVSQHRYKHQNWYHQHDRVARMAQQKASMFVVNVPPKMIPKSRASSIAILCSDLILNACRKELQCPASCTFCKSSPARKGLILIFLCLWRHSMSMAICFQSATKMTEDTCSNPDCSFMLGKKQVLENGRYCLPHSVLGRKELVF